MNAPALLALVGDLYAQLLAAQDRIAQLEAELQASQVADVQAERQRPASARPHGASAQQNAA